MTFINNIVLHWCKMMQHTRMWVVEVDLLWMRHRFGTWLSHMAFRALTCGNLRQASVTQSTPLIQCVGQGLPYNLKIMAPSHRQTCIPPLKFSCHPVAADPRSRTAMGRHCRLLSCGNLGNGIHFSHSIYCTFQFDASAPASIPELHSPIIYSVKFVSLVPLQVCNLNISAHSSLQHPTQSNMP